MTLLEFTDMWVKDNRKLIICESDHDELVDYLVEIADGDRNLEDIYSGDWVICTINPYLETWRINCYLRKEYVEAEIEQFFIGDSYLLVAINQKVRNVLNERSE